MVKMITVSKLTEKGQVLLPEKAPEILAKVIEINRTYGGRIESMWAVNGRYDFVTIAEYPSDVEAFKARTKINQLGVFHLEAMVAQPVETFIEALLEKKALVAV
jgi:uncharacterized protein with GYD domain